MSSISSLLDGECAAAARTFSETCTIFLCMKLASGYFARKPCQIPPRKNGRAASSRFSASSAWRTSW